MWMKRLYDYCRMQPLTKTTLLVERFDQGDQWLAWLCAQYGPVINIEVETVRTLVVKKTKTALARQGVTLLNNGQTYWIVHQLMLELAARYTHYIPAELVTTGIVRSFHDALQQCRLAGLQAHQ